MLSAPARTHHIDRQPTIIIATRAPWLVHQWHACTAWYVSSRPYPNWGIGNRCRMRQSRRDIRTCAVPVAAQHQGCGSTDEGRAERRSPSRSIRTPRISGHYSFAGGRHPDRRCAVIRIYGLNIRVRGRCNVNDRRQCAGIHRYLLARHFRPKPPRSLPCWFAYLMAFASSAE